MLLKRAVRIFCVVPIATGTLDLVLGAAVLRRAGADIPDSLTTDQVLTTKSASGERSGLDSACCSGRQALTYV